MIISASRRTDIPAFYSEWLINRLREGHVLVRNPMNFHQVSRIALSPAAIDCLVFWTKDPRNMLARLPEIAGLGYPFYFLFTLTAYDRRIEQNVPPLPERLETFRALAARIGKGKVIWRYDPIFFTGRHSEDFHRQAFARLAECLAGHTERCIVSFLHMYRKCSRNMRGLDLAEPEIPERVALIRSMRDLCAEHGMQLQTCAQGGELGEELVSAGIAPGRCIDGELVARLSRREITAARDKNQRQECGCVESIDIGAYNTCPHHCLYCYANSDRNSVARNVAAHHPASPLLYGTLGEMDRVTDRKIGIRPPRQHRLF